jgi:1-deoxy-D-xylulose-5-phosphate synthase
MVELGRERSDLVAITAAMLHPVGLHKFAAQHPERTFDVGIAEQHAATSAAGLALGGLHPVVAVYATFLNRGFDQVLMDVALHRAGVTFVLDRAGVTGDDGASHHGMWDLALLRLVPGLRVAAPRDEATLREELREAVAVEDGPTVVRYPKGSLPAPIPAIHRVGGVDVLARHVGDGAQRVLVVGVGAMVPAALGVAERLAAQGIGATVVDPRWVLPVPAALVDLARGHDVVVTVEDGLEDNGVGSAVRSTLARAGLAVPVQSHGLPTAFIPHASRAEVIEEHGLRAQDVAREAAAAVVHALAEEPAF